MWTPPALASEARAWTGDLWRVVESQSRVATLKLVDTLDEQAILEAELEGSKPLIPASCVHLDTLLATPFRYAPYRTGSRFRRHRQIEGCFYASELVETAIAEAAFHGLLFFLDAPAARRPSNPQERTAIHVPGGTTAAIRYRSVRDPGQGINLALLSPAAFRKPRPDRSQTWHVFLREASVQALREMPRSTLEFRFSGWAADPRVPARLSG